MYILDNLKLCAIAILTSYGLFLQVQIVLSLADPEPLTAKDEMMLTHEQKKDFKKLKEEVMDLIVADYMKEDMYLVKRFRGKLFDLGQSVQAIKDTLKFREQYAVDGIVKEDWSAYKTFFPYNIISDKKERPVFTAITAKWELAPQLEAGNGFNVTRNYIGILEYLSSVAIMKYVEKEKISRFVMIVDFHNAPIRSATCLLCLPFIKQAVGMMSDNYPYFPYRIVIINSPPFGLKALEAVKPMINRDDRAIVVAFDTNVTVWRPYLAKLLDGEENIPTEFYTGGVSKMDPTGGDASALATVWGL